MNYHSSDPYLKQTQHRGHPSWSVIGLNQGLMDLHNPGDPLEEECEGVRENNVESFISGSGFQSLLQIILICGGELPPEVEGELVEADTVEVDEREYFEKSLNRGQILSIHGLIKPSVYYSTNLTETKLNIIKKKNRLMKIKVDSSKITFREWKLTCE